MISGVGLAMAKTMASGAMVAASSGVSAPAMDVPMNRSAPLMASARLPLIFSGLVSSASLALWPSSPAGAARDQDAVLVDGDDVLGTGHLQHVDDGRTGRAGAVLHNFNILDAFAHHFQGVEHTGQHDDGGTVLVIVEDGDVQVTLQLSFDLEALGAADVLQVDAAEGRGQWP